MPWQGLFARERVDYSYRMDSVRLREATLDDARGIAVVHVDSWRAAYRGLLADDLLAGLQVEHRTKNWTRWLTTSLAGLPTDSSANVHHRLLVAEEPRRGIIGWTAFGAGRDDGYEQVGELAALYVHPDYWSRRIGHALLTRAEKELRSAGWQQAYLWVLRGNSRAIRFYERHGWQSDGGEKTVETADGHRFDELRHYRVLD